MEDHKNNRIIEQLVGMRRKSVKKASTFKLQNIKNKFKDYLDNVQQAPTVLKHPHLRELIYNTSQRVFELCYSFSDDSTFLRGLNYDNKFIGFSIFENIVTYREYLPNIKKAYLLGEFNGFNESSHELLRDEEQQEGWFIIQVDTNEHHIIEGSKIVLRLVDIEGRQSKMIPPSCHVIDEGYGIYCKAQKWVCENSSSFLDQLLAYRVDLSQIPLNQCAQFVEKQTETLQCFNTIIIKNLFLNQCGLIHKFSLNYKKYNLLKDLISKIKNQCGLKVVFEWSFQRGNLHYEHNTVQEVFLKKVGQQYQFDVSKNQVLSYYLANISYYYNNFGIDGIHFTQVGKMAVSSEGVTLLKCINIMNERLSENVITLASSKDEVVGITGNILDGSLGFSFTYNHHGSMLFSSNHIFLYEKFSHIENSSNCLSIDFSNFSGEHYLNLFLVYLLSNKGVFGKGDFSHVKQPLKRVLKLRSQSEFFSQQANVLKCDENLLVFRRSNCTILFNFSKEQISERVESADQLQIIFCFNNKVPEIKDEIVTLQSESCVLMGESV